MCPPISQTSTQQHEVQRGLNTTRHSRTHAPTHPHLHPELCVHVYERMRAFLEYHQLLLMFSVHNAELRCCTVVCWLCLCSSPYSESAPIANTFGSNRIDVHSTARLAAHPNHLHPRLFRLLHFQLVIFLILCSVACIASIQRHRCVVLCAHEQQNSGHCI